MRRPGKTPSWSRTQSRAAVAQKLLERHRRGRRSAAGRWKTATRRRRAGAVARAGDARRHLDLPLGTATAAWPRCARAGCSVPGSKRITDALRYVMQSMHFGVYLFSDFADCAEAGRHAAVATHFAHARSASERKLVFVGRSVRTAGGAGRNVRPASPTRQRMRRAPAPARRTLGDLMPATTARGAGPDRRHRPRRPARAVRCARLRRISRRSIRPRISPQARVFLEEDAAIRWSCWSSARGPGEALAFCARAARSRCRAAGAGDRHARQSQRGLAARAARRRADRMDREPGQGGRAHGARSRSLAACGSAAAARSAAAAIGSDRYQFAFDGSLDELADRRSAERAHHRGQRDVRAALRLSRARRLLGRRASTASTLRCRRSSAPSCSASSARGQRAAARAQAARRRQRLSGRPARAAAVQDGRVVHFYRFREIRELSRYRGAERAGRGWRARRRRRRHERGVARDDRLARAWISSPWSRRPSEPTGESQPLATLPPLAPAEDAPDPLQQPTLRRVLDGAETRCSRRRRGAIAPTMPSSARTHSNA